MQSLVNFVKRYPAAWGALVVATCALLTVSSLFSAPGLPNTAEGYLHLFHTLELGNLWCSGNLYPRWAPDFALGFGSPVFNYAPPLLRYLAMGLHLVGLGLQDALKAVLILSVLAAGIGIFLFCRTFLSDAAASAAGAAYVLAPYRYYQLYVQGDYPQVLALALAPYCLWAAARLISTPARSWALLLSFLTALLIAADVATAIVFLPLLVIFLLWRSLPRWELGRLVYYTLLLLAGISIAAFYWLPAFLELEFVRAGSSADTGDLVGQFLNFPELIALPESLDLRSANPYFPWGLGGHLLLLAIPSLASLGTANSRRPYVIFMWLAVLVLALMAMPVARGLWSSAVIATFVRFPHRLLGAASFCLAVLVGCGIDYWQGIRRRLWLGLTLAVAIAVVAPYAFPRTPFLDQGEVAVADIREYEKSSGAIGMTSDGQYLPRWAQDLSPNYLELAGELPTLLSVSNAERTFRVTLAQPRLQELPQLYLPWWQARVDGVPVTLEPASPSGLIQVLLDEGQHLISLHLENSLLQRFSWRLSVLGCLLLLLLMPMLGSISPVRLSFAINRDVADTVLLAAASAVVAIGVLVKVGYLEKSNSNPFSLSSPSGEVLGVQHQTSIRFGDSIELLGYDLQRNLPPQGESIWLKLYWQPLRSLNTDYHVFVHLDSLVDGTTFVVSDTAAPGGIPSSHWHPALYVEDRHELRLPGDLPAVKYALRVGIYDPETGTSLAVSGGESSIVLQELQVLYHLPLDVRRFPADNWYRFGDSIRLLGYRLENTTLSAGAATTLVLYWRADSPVEVNMKRFVHLVNANNTIIAQWDEWPVKGLYPTGQWLPQHIIADEITVMVPLSAAPGEYSLVVGLYDVYLNRPTVSRKSGITVPESAALLPERLLVR